MNGFQIHGIERSSPSQINTFANCPAAWVADKLFGLRTPQSIAALRGMLIEKAVMDVIGYGRTETDAIGDAIKEYNKQLAFSHAAKLDNERDMIAPCVALAVQELKQYGHPDILPGGSQHEVRITCNGDGWKLPIIGRLDFWFKQHGVCIDLKTSSRCPSEMSDNHKRQQAVYRQALGNHTVKFLYVTPKKAVFLEPDNHLEALADIKRILNRKERFLRLGNKELLASIVHYDPTSFYLSNAGQDIKNLFELDRMGK